MGLAGDPADYGRPKPTPAQSRANRVALLIDGDQVCQDLSSLALVLEVTNQHPSLVNMATQARIHIQTMARAMREMELELMAE